MPNNLLVGKRAEYLPICHKGIGLATKEGYGVAIHHPLRQPTASMSGAILWFRDRQAVETASLTALASPLLSAGVEYILHVDRYHSSAQAVQALLELGISKP